MKSIVSFMGIVSFICILSIFVINCNDDEEKAETYACNYTGQVSTGSCNVCIETQQKDQAAADSVCATHSGIATKGECTKANVCQIVDSSNNVTSYWTITQTICTSLNTGNLTTTWMP